jgi:hypothetical protein
LGGEERKEEKRKGPQGYDEDNASLDKFCKIKAKKGETQGRPTAGVVGKKRK